ncbi:MAG: NAD(P)-binding domain-containing protein, partial [Micromonosporaceae bacterium]
MSSPRSTPADRPGRLHVGVIGAGRVGSVLGAALGRAGHHVVAAAAVSQASLTRAARLLPEAEVLPSDQVAAQADLLLIAVGDDSLEPLVRGLAETDSIRPGQLLAHT